MTWKEFRRLLKILFPYCSVLKLILEESSKIGKTLWVLYIPITQVLNDSIMQLASEQATSLNQR